MEMPLVNESSFTPANPASYSLEDFWPLGDHVRVLERRAGVVMDSLGNRDGSAEESTVTEQSLSRNGVGDGRKRRAVVESSTVANTSSCGGDDTKNSSFKRGKVLEVKEEKKNLKEELDGTSVTCTKHGKQNTNDSELPKLDYIHVRARRGQATDSHSLAERARREKISERMKTLQDLVPGCNKVVGKALVLDEIINYVLSLQHQVEFLSMKLEAINSSIIPSDNMLPDKNLEVKGFNSDGMVQPTEEYAQGPQSEWLHMHLGANFQRATQ